MNEQNQQKSPSSGVYAIKVNCNNEIEVITALINIYATSVSIRNGMPKLRKKLASLLSYYIKYGYSKQTKELAAESLGASALNINVMNSELTKLGYLIPDTRNLNNKHLNSELTNLKQYYLGKTGLPVFAIVLNNESK